MDEKQHYVNMLKVVRQNAGYQQRQVAGILGQRSAATLCEWENGKKMPSGNFLIKLCILYDKTPRELYPKYCQYLRNVFF